MAKGTENGTAHTSVLSTQSCLLTMDIPKNVPKKARMWRRAILKTVAEIKKMLGSHRDDLRDGCGVKEIGIFGSYVREEQKETSDVDILVEFEMPVGLLAFAGLKNYLSDYLGVEVDLV